METRTTQKINGMINLPVSLEQLAQGLLKLSRSELITLELLLDKQAMRTIEQSLKDTKAGRVKRLSA